MTKKYSYCLIGSPQALEGVKREKEVALSGLWQWPLSFDKHGKKGDVKLLRRKEEYEDYDVVAINMTVGNLPLLQHTRDELGTSSSTKLVTNIDFDVGAWGKVWTYPTLLEKALQCADLVFHVESRGAATLEHVLSRKVYTLPHPVDVDGLDKYKTDDRDPCVACISHRYKQDITTQYWAVRDIPLTSVLLGYQKGTVPSLSMFDEDIGKQSFLDYITIMSRAMFALDMFAGYTYGRTVCEFASLAVPCVCSETIEAGRRLFPELCVNPYNVKGANTLLKRLMDDEEFHHDVYTSAYIEAGYYSQKRSYDRMVEALEEVGKEA